MAAPFPRCDETGAWAALQRHFAGAGKSFDVRTAMDAQRVAAFSLQAPHVFADLSKNLLDATGHDLLLQLARDCALEAQRDAMFRGERINATEDRAVMHWLLREPEGARVDAAVARELAEVHGTLAPMLAFAEQVRSDAAITDVVNIGIGGSDLGPQMAVIALDTFAARGKRFHFVSNVDGHELAAVLRGLKPDSTLFLVASKTFTTIETMTNARSARQWFTDSGGTDVARHFAALTTNVQAAADFGIDRTFGFWDWVGGRYSLWSAIGLPIAIAVGATGFPRAAGRRPCDGPALPHRPAGCQPAGAAGPAGRLVPRLPRLRQPQRGAVPQRAAPLAGLPAAARDGEQRQAGRPARPRAAVRHLAGGLGRAGHQWPARLLPDAAPGHRRGAGGIHRRARAGAHAGRTPPQLLANVLAQAQALMLGKSDPGGHKHFPGNRPSTMLLLDRLEPASLGALIALYEHRVFCAGALWGINSFDQWGVELGKVLARDIAPRLATGDTAGLDASTAALLQRLRS
jgi:glucose-6-phosphate isomerase